MLYPLNKKYIFFGISLTFVLLINLYFRSFPINFPQLKAQARDIAVETIRQYAMRDIQQKFPQYDPAAKNRLLKSRLKQYIKLNKKQINDQTRKLYYQLKDKFQDDSGQTYIMELDCWHWARYVENVVRRGRPGDETIYDSEWDLYMLAPHGFRLQWQQFLYYFSAYLYKFFTLFRQVKLYTFLFYLPLFFSAIFIIVLYIFTCRYSGHIGAVISCLFIGLAPTFLHRSCAGWFDKDTLNMIFPVLIIWTYTRSYTDRTLRRRLFWICFSSFWVGLFCFNWTHWWFVFFIVIIYEIIMLASLIFTHFYFKQDKAALVKQHTACLFSFLAFSLFWILVIAGKQPIKVLYTETIKAAVLTKPLITSVWPNVLYTVGELRKANIPGISQSLGGVWVFASTFICMAIPLMRVLFYRKYPKYKQAAIIIFNIWFVVMLFASLRGIRFVMFLLMPLGICTGWLMEDIFSYFRKNKYIIGAAGLSAVLLFAGGSYLKTGYRAAEGLYPLIDDTWYRVLNVIKEKTPQNAILNSWWDFGDWFKVIARRRVIFDGQSQIYPQAYWMAKAILSPDEKRAVAILRMLNNGGNEAFEIMNEYIEDPLEAVLLLEGVMMMPPKDAQGVLISYMPIEAMNKLMKLLFYNPASAYFVAEDTMAPKIGAISYLGNWDFSKVYIAQNLGLKEKDKIIGRLDELGEDKQLIEKFYQEAFLITPESLDDWLSNRLQFYSPLVNGKKKDEAVIFDNGYVYKSEEGIIYSKDGHIPRSLFIFKDYDIKEILYDNPNVIYSALISKGEAEDSYKLILLDRELGKSLFSRLYFFRGKGLKHFQSFIDVEEGNKYIRVYNIAW